MSKAIVQENAALFTGLTDGPVSAAPLAWPAGCGAESIFLGRTRIESHPTLGPLVRLEYEVYDEMVSQLMDGLAREAVRRYGCQAIRLVHAKGAVEPGQASVVIQVATPHRKEAFEACRYLIDRLKHELPVWKRQIWEKGDSFVEGCCAGQKEDMIDE